MPASMCSGSFIGPRHARGLMRIVAVTIVFHAAAPCLAWRANVRGLGLIVLDPAGNVFVTRSVPTAHSGGTVGVARLSARTGVQAWHRSYKVAGPEHSDTINVMRTASNGDVITAGTVEIDGLLTFDVARLAGRTGRFLWRRTLAGATRDPVAAGHDEAVAMAL